MKETNSMATIDKTTPAKPEARPYLDKVRQVWKVKVKRTDGTWQGILLGKSDGTIYPTAQVLRKLSTVTQPPPKSSNDLRLIELRSALMEEWENETLERTKVVEIFGATEASPELINRMADFIMKLYHRDWDHRRAFLATLDETIQNLLD
jgi:hypothetical protein